jgi:hypothetical protein
MEMNMLSQVYESKYAGFCDHIGYVLQSMSEEAGSTLNSAAKSGGPVAVQALLDAVMDAGHRAVLVQALNSPSVAGWVREKLEVFLYGDRKQVPALFHRVRTFH